MSQVKGQPDPPRRARRCTHAMYIHTYVRAVTVYSFLIDKYGVFQLYWYTLVMTEPERSHESTTIPGKAICNPYLMMHMS